MHFPLIKTELQKWTLPSDTPTHLIIWKEKPEHSNYLLSEGSEVQKHTWKRCKTSESRAVRSEAAAVGLCYLQRRARNPGLGEWPLRSHRDKKNNTKCHPILLKHNTVSGQGALHNHSCSKTSLQILHKASTKVPVIEQERKKIFSWYILFFGVLGKLLGRFRTFQHIFKSLKLLFPFFFLCTLKMML